MPALSKDVSEKLEKMTAGLSMWQVWRIMTKDYLKIFFHYRSWLPPSPGQIIFVALMGVAVYDGKWLIVPFLVLFFLVLPPTMATLEIGILRDIKKAQALDKDKLDRDREEKL